MPGQRSPARSAAAPRGLTRRAELRRYNLRRRRRRSRRRRQKRLAPTKDAGLAAPPLCPRAASFPVFPHLSHPLPRSPSPWLCLAPSLLFRGAGSGRGRAAAGRGRRGDKGSCREGGGIAGTATARRRLPREGAVAHGKVRRGSSVAGREGGRGGGAPVRRRAQSERGGSRHRRRRRRRPEPRRRRCCTSGTSGSYRSNHTVGPRGRGRAWRGWGPAPAPGLPPAPGRPKNSHPTRHRIVTGTPSPQRGDPRGGGPGPPPNPLPAGPRLPPRPQRPQDTLPTLEPPFLGQPGSGPLRAVQGAPVKAAPDRAGGGRTRKLLNSPATCTERSGRAQE